MANRWGNNGNVDRFILLGSKITADGERSHEIKRSLLLRRKAMTNLGGSLVTQLCPTLATPWTVATRLLCPWDSPGKNTGVGCHLWGRTELDMTDVTRQQ